MKQQPEVAAFSGSSVWNRSIADWDFVTGCGIISTTLCKTLPPGKGAGAIPSSGWDTFSFHGKFSLSVNFGWAESLGNGKLAGGIKFLWYELCGLGMYGKGGGDLWTCDCDTWLCEEDCPYRSSCFWDEDLSIVDSSSIDRSLELEQCEHDILEHDDSVNK